MVVTTKSPMAKLRAIVLLVGVTEPFASNGVADSAKGAAAADPRTARRESEKDMVWNLNPSGNSNIGNLGRFANTAIKW